MRGDVVMLVTPWFRHYTIKLQKCSIVNNTELGRRWC